MSIGKFPTIKLAKAPTMTDYKSSAKASHGEKLKSMGVGRVGASGQAKLSPMNVTHGPAAAREMAGMESEAQDGLTSELARGGRVSPSHLNVTHGKAAEREMAQMERIARQGKGGDYHRCSRRPSSQLIALQQLNECVFIVSAGNPGCGA